MNVHELMFTEQITKVFHPDLIVKVLAQNKQNRINLNVFQDFKCVASVYYLTKIYRKTESVSP